MSYENMSCPCGGRKPTDTMLCEDCERAFADRPEMATMRDGEATVEYRRTAAIILVTLARKRGRCSPPPPTSRRAVRVPN